MCGIAGSVTKNLIDENVIKKTLFLMQNRGPDSQDFRDLKINITTVFTLQTINSGSRFQGLTNHSITKLKY